MGDRTGQSLLSAVEALGYRELGRSVEGRPIFGRAFGVHTFGGSSGGSSEATARPLLIFGGIHGDEPASVEAMLDLAERLALEKTPPPLVVLPLVNPDGIVRGCKNSARDVDLNRNFPARSFVTAHAPGYFPGPTPLSEPESRVVADVVEGGIRGAIAVHAPLACVNYDGPAARWAEAVAAACGWPARGDIGYPTPGSFGSWLGIDRGLPVLTLELPPGPLAPFRQAARDALEASISQAPEAPSAVEPHDR
ncbi:MAG TPA: M14 family zinc carboxypeptidase [Polyangia bacterium]|nr:M14 family zinc carboxypeptidase [Polyangia bacterium]